MSTSAVRGQQESRAVPRITPRVKSDCATLDFALIGILHYYISSCMKVLGVIKEIRLTSKWPTWSAHNEAFCSAVQLVAVNKIRCHSCFIGTMLRVTFDLSRLLVWHHQRNFFR